MTTLGGVNASICKECGLWQNKFGWIIPQLSIGDLTLYAAVAVLLIATFRSLLFGASADLVVRPLSCGKSQVDLALINDGTGTGIVSGPAITVRASGNRQRVTDAIMKIDGKTVSAVAISPTDPMRLASLTVTSTGRAGLFEVVSSGDEMCEVSVGFSQSVSSNLEPEPLIQLACTCQEFFQ